MKLKDASYDALVEKHMHSHKQMTEEETKAEIEEITGGVISSFAKGEIYNIPQGETHTQIKSDGSRDILVNGKVEGNFMPPKKRGRPLGSRNKPKEIK